MGADGQAELIYFYKGLALYANVSEYIKEYLNDEWRRLGGYEGLYE